MNRPCRSAEMSHRILVDEMATLAGRSWPGLVQGFSARVINCVWQLIMHILVKQCRIDSPNGFMGLEWPWSYVCVWPGNEYDTPTPLICHLWAAFDTRIYEINNEIFSARVLPIVPKILGNSWLTLTLVGPRSMLRFMATASAGVATLVKFYWFLIV